MRADRAMGEGANNNKRIDLAAPLRSVRRADAPPRYKADLKSGPIRHPGKVPFVWEQRPGQPKSVRTRRGPPPTPPRDAPPSLTRPEDVHGSPYHDALGELFGPVSAPHRQEDDNVEEDEEERFSDALDTLSRTESLTMNCSVSGLSGAPADAARGAAEPGARGFMMDRFLPAAHAVAVGSPQYTFRKAGAAGSATGNSGREHARAAAVRASMANGDDRTRRAPVQLPHQHLPPNYLSCAYPRREEHDEDEEDDDDDYDVQSTRGFSSKGCGLLPGLCVKTSMLLMNPVPAMKRGKAQGRGRGRQFSSKGPSPLARSSQNKPIGCDSNAQSWEDVYKHKLEQKYLGHGDDGRSKLTSESNQLTFWSDSPSGDGSSPFHHSMAGGMSPYHSYAAMSPLSKANGSFRTGDRDEKARGSNGSGSLGRDHDRSSLVESDESSFKGSSSMSSGLDRTGHEDSMDHRGDIGPEIGHLSSLLETKADLNANVNDSQSQGQQIVGKNSTVKNQDDDQLVKNISGTRESTLSMLCGNPGMERLDDGKHLMHDAHLEAPLHSEENRVAKKEIMPLQSLLPLPVPKSPSESWLSRTLPSVANKPPMPSFLGIQVQSKKQAPWASMHTKENDKKPSRTRQIRFADVVERPISLDSEI
ncbi:hypothetical protein QOZ80_UnG0729700 [Eleusine coracana subsp. coracana]|uniref:Uncharacterized protein n=1 Tax=Eleusine coracana subsp. coracana TaxID=191504 RepID=A0AAV9FWF1_ELECO|nr:hypothetical protein QOZ80_UnG0729700 [Eleusine coracana subsp. coracana]